MNTTVLKILAVLSVFVGELFAIYAETFGVKSELFSAGFWKVFLIMTVGGLFLILGYLVGYKAYQNLWILAVVSITTLLIAEPLIILIFFNQMPSTGTLIGFVLGIIGLIAALFF
jgi:hypothetical protein